MSDQVRVTRQHVEVSITVEHRHAMANGHGGNQAVDKTTNGFAPLAAASIQNCRAQVVGGVTVGHIGATQQTTQFVKMLLVARPREHLHSDSVSDR